MRAQIEGMRGEGHPAQPIQPEARLATGGWNPPGRPRRGVVKLGGGCRPVGLFSPHEPRVTAPAAECPDPGLGLREPPPKARGSSASPNRVLPNGCRGRPAAIPISRWRWRELFPGDQGAYFPVGVTAQPVRQPFPSPPDS